MNLDALIQQQRQHLLARDTQLLAALGATYDLMCERLLVESNALLGKMDAARAAGVAITLTWLLRQRRLNDVLSTVQARVQSFADQAAATIMAEQNAAVRMAIHYIKQRIAMQSTFALTPLSSSVIDAISKGSRLPTLFARFDNTAADQLRRELINAVALGQSPSKTATRIRQILNLPRHQTMTSARTETLRAYRAASYHIAHLHQDILAGWFWTASMSARTCAFCLVKHGTFHPLDEPLESHPNCRCTLRFITNAFAALEFSQFPET